MKIYTYLPINPGDYEGNLRINVRKLVKECDIEQLTDEKYVDIIKQIQAEFKYYTPMQNYEFFDDDGNIVAYAGFISYGNTSIYTMLIRQPDGEIQAFEHSEVLTMKRLDMDIDKLREELGINKDI